MSFNNNDETSSQVNNNKVEIKSKSKQYFSFLIYFHVFIKILKLINNSNIKENIKEKLI